MARLTISINKEMLPFTMTTIFLIFHFRFVSTVSSLTNRPATFYFPFFDNDELFTERM